jgi:Fe-S cluster biogenesis protein NfuA
VPRSALWRLAFPNKKEFHPQKYEEAAMKERVQKIIDEIRPALQADGGNIELVEVGEDGIVKVRLMGACGSCPMSQLTLKRGVEARLKAKVPEVKEVVSV